MSNSNKPIFSNYPLEKKNSKCYTTFNSTFCISYPFIISIVFISLFAFAVIGFLYYKSRSRNHKALPSDDLGQNNNQNNQQLVLDLEDIENPYQTTTEALLK